MSESEAAAGAVESPASPNPYAPPTAAPRQAVRDFDYQPRHSFGYEQARVNSLLTRGIVFTIIWIAGFGSLYSIFLAVKSHRMIRKSGGALRGMARVWWCYIVGGLGVAMLLTAAVAIAIHR